MLIVLLAAAVAAPPLPPLPPLVVDAADPVVTVTIGGAPLRLRLDPGTAQQVELNASAAQRLGLAAPGRTVAGKPVQFGRSLTQVGKVQVSAVTSEEIVQYQGRDVPMTLAWPKDDPVTGVDGLINPNYLPHAAIRFVHRPPAPTDVTTRLPLRWDENRGLLGDLGSGRDRIDVVIAPAAPESLATAATASILARGFGGALRGPARDVMVSHGVSRPVRDLVFTRPVDVAGVRLPRVAARVFDWSGPTEIPDADPGNGEMVVGGRAGRQRQWAKLALGADVLGACAEITFTRVPLAMELVCPALP